jgi:hypothetical protein
MTTALKAIYRVEKTTTTNPNRKRSSWDKKRNESSITIMERKIFAAKRREELVSCSILST